MKTSTTLRLLPLFLLGSCLFADELSWGGTWAGVWTNFATGPYSANNVTTGQPLMIFCLDYNDEIAPPFDWEASIYNLTPTNVDTTAQFGGNYPVINGHAITTTPWAFTSDSGSGGHSVNLASGADDAYTRYVEAAWLFTNILAAQAHGDLTSMIVNQVAAWNLFVENQNLADLRGRVLGTAGTFSYTNYEASLDNYATAPGQSTTGGLSFRDAVNVALAGAQTAVENQNWYSSSFAPRWDLVTTDPNWAATSLGRPAQEFLTPTVTPEPASIILLGSLLFAVVTITRKKFAPLS